MKPSSLLLTPSIAVLLAACGGGSSDSPSSPVDPAPLLNDPGTYSCEGCPDSTINEFLVQTSEASFLLSGQVSGAIGDGQYFLSSAAGQSSRGPIPTDANGNFDFTLGLSCGSQIVKCVWSNETGQYVLVTEVIRDCDDTPGNAVDNNPDESSNTDDTAPSYCLEPPFTELAGTYQGTVVFSDSYFQCEHEISLTINPLNAEDTSNYLCERTGEIKINSRRIGEDAGFACGNYTEAVDVPVIMNPSYIGDNIEFDLQRGEFIRTADFAYPIRTLVGTPGVPEIAPIGTGGTKPPPHFAGWNFNQDGTVTHSDDHVYTGMLSR